MVHRRAFDPYVAFISLYIPLLGLNKSTGLQRFALATSARQPVSAIWDVFHLPSSPGMATPDSAQDGARQLEN